LLRTVKLFINFLLTALVFTFFMQILILFLNPLVALSPVDLLLMFLDLAIFFVPLWFLIIALAFLIVQFFSESHYPIGFIDPPTPIYFFSFTILIISAIIYSNYEYYLDFFNNATRFKFIRLLLLLALLIILGILFIFLKGRKKRLIQLLFSLVLLATIAFSFLLLPISGPLQAPPLKVPQVFTTPRTLRIVVMEGLSWDFIRGMSPEQKLLNFNWINENGVVGRLTTFTPNFELSMLTSLLTGLRPNQYPLHSDSRFTFRDVDAEFDIFPRYIFFRNSTKLGLVTFFKKGGREIDDSIRQYYRSNGFETTQLVIPDIMPISIFSEKDLKKNNTFVQFFADTLDKKDAKLTILKKAFFYDDFVRRQIRGSKESSDRYSLAYLNGLEKVIAHFFPYLDRETFASVAEAGIDKYGGTIERYYQYYDSIIGKLIASMGDDEMLVVLSFYEAEALPPWRRVVANVLGRRDVFVYKPLRSQGTILMYEKAALKRGQYLDSLSITDVFPTLMYYAGFPLSRRLQGEVCRDIFADEFVKNNPIYFLLE